MAERIKRPRGVADATGGYAESWADARDIMRAWVADGADPDTYGAARGEATRIEYEARARFRKRIAKGVGRGMGYAAPAAESESDVLVSMGHAKKMLGLRKSAIKTLLRNGVLNGRRVYGVNDELGEDNEGRPWAITLTSIKAYDLARREAGRAAKPKRLETE